MNSSYDIGSDSFIKTTIFVGPIQAGETITFIDSFIHLTSKPDPSRPLYSVIDAANNNCMCSPFVVSPFLTALPIRWLYFNAMANGNRNVNLNWEVNENKPGSRFHIYRSYNLNSWHTINTVNTQQSSQTLFQYTDDKLAPEPMQAHYKITMVLPNGTIKESAIETVYFKQPNTLIAHPNPSNQKTTLTIPNEFLPNQTIRALDMQGKLIYSHILPKTENEIITWELETQHWNQGIYTIIVNAKHYKLIVDKH